MYGLGISEIAVIFLVLLLFFKPEEIFSFFRKTGQWYSRINKMQKDMEDMISKEFTDSKDQDGFGFDIENENKYFDDKES